MGSRDLYKILFVTNDFLPMVGGVSFHVDSLAKALSQIGCDVTVLHVCYRSIEPIKETRSGYKIVRAIVANDLADKTTLTHKITRHLANYLRGKEHLLELVESFQPDIVHWHDYYHSALITKAIKAKSPLKICTNHASQFLEQYAKGPLFHIYLKFFAMHADGIIAPSQELEKKSRIINKPTRFIANGVDENVFKPTRKLRLHCCEHFGIDPSSTIILAPRRIDPKNGLKTLIQSIPSVAKEFSNITVMIAGGGPQDLVKQYQNEADALGVTDLIKITGILPYEWMARLMPSSDIVVIPSFYEAVSLAALEALSCGIPVIASDVGGLPHIINSGNGILVPPGDAQALAIALKQLISDEDLRLRKGRNGRQTILNGFTWQKVAKDTLKFYSELHPSRQP